MGKGNHGNRGTWAWYLQVSQRSGIKNCSFIARSQQARKRSCGDWVSRWCDWTLGQEKSLFVIGWFSGEAVGGGGGNVLQFSLP